MRLARLPFFDALEGADSVLLAGAGGGYDIFVGLPLYFALQPEPTRVGFAPDVERGSCYPTIALSWFRYQRRPSRRNAARPRRTVAA